jgi:hypothetical protein
MTVQGATPYLLFAAFGGLGVYNGYLSYRGWTKGRKWRPLFAALTALILFVAAWRAWPL